MRAMKTRMRSRAIIVVALLYVVVAILIRWLVPLNSAIYGVLVYAVPLLAFILIALFWPRGASTGDIRITPPPGALGESTVEEQLEDLRRLLEDVRARQANEQRVSQELGQLDKLIRAVKNSSVWSQLVSFALGILATWLLTGVPGPFSWFFARPC